MCKVPVFLRAGNQTSFFFQFKDLVKDLFKMRSDLADQISRRTTPQRLCGAVPGSTRQAFVAYCGIV